jgi:cytochrome c oxidase subunit 2
MLLIGAVASAIGIALALAIDWFPTQASTQAKKIDDLFDVLLIASVPIFVLVEVVVLFSVWKFRMRPGQELEDGAPIHGNTTLEVVWTAIPAMLMVGLSVYAYVVLRDIEKKPKNEMIVNVHAQQFAWSFEYPQAGGKPIRSDQLYLEKDRPVEFHVRSDDVIHDFWVPEFRLKSDAVPGLTTHVRTTPTRVGKYDVVCAELCGIGHSTMRQRVSVVPAASFDKWVSHKKASGGDKSDLGGDTASVTPGVGYGGAVGGLR